MVVVVGYGASLDRPGSSFGYRRYLPIDSRFRQQLIASHKIISSASIMLQTILDRLDNVRPSTNGWIANCPACGDTGQHLQVSQQGEKILLCCLHYTGAQRCRTEAIMQAIGMSRRDLFQKQNDRPTPKPIVRPSPKPSPSQMPQIGGKYRDGVVENIYAYTDENNNPLYYIARVVKDEVNSKGKRKKEFPGFRMNGSLQWGLGDARKVPYLLPRLQDSEDVFLVEGEKCVHALVEHGWNATTTSGGSKGWKPEYAVYFKDKHVFIIPDNDEDGEGYARAAAADLSGVADVRMIRLPDLPQAGDVVDFLDRFSDQDEANKALGAAVDASISFDGLPVCMSAAAFLCKRRPALQYHIDGLLPYGGKLTFSATSKFGKSMWAIQTGFCIAAGDCEWLGMHFGPAARVLYLQAEIMDALVEARLRALIETMPDALDAERAVNNFVIQEIAESRPNLYTPEGRAVAEKLILKHRPQVLILDPLAALCPGMEENESKDMSQVLDYFTGLTLKHNVAIILVHHHGKAGVSRGSSCFEAWPESDISATFLDEEHTIGKIEMRLRCAYNSGPVYWQAPRENDLWFKPMPEGWEPEKRQVRQAVTSPEIIQTIIKAEGPMTAKALVEMVMDKLGVKERKAYSLIKEAKENGLVAIYMGCYTVTA